MKQALVLDFGNVISEPQDTSCYDRMGEMSGLGADFFRNAFWKYRPQFDRGDIRGIPMYQAVLADGGMIPDTRDEAGCARRDALAERLLAEDLESWFHISRSVTDWALGVQKAGFTLGILSNMPHDFLERYADRIELFKKADVPVFSCLEREIKPEPAIYRILIARLGIPAHDIVFFDDLEANVLAARREGMQAFLWTDLAQAQKDWTSAE